MKPKVLYLCPNGYLGGAERFVLEAGLIHLSQNSDLDAEILFFGDGVAVDKAHEYGIKCRVLENQFRFKNIVQLYKALKEIKSIVENENFNIVHSTMPYAHIISSMALQFSTVKKLWFQHGPLTQWDPIGAFFSTDAILYNTTYLRDEHCKNLKQSFSPSIEKIVPYSINEDKPEPSEVSRIKEEIGNDKFRILLLGRICPWKGYETAFKALHQLFEKFPAFKNIVRLSVVGDVGRTEDQPYYDGLKDLVKKYQLEEVVKFWGQQQNPQNFMGSHHVFLHTSNIPEPFGLVVGEAMICGALCVGSSVGGTPEMIKHFETGIGFDSTSEDADDLLYPHLENLVSSFYAGNFENDYGQLISAGIAHIQNNFSRKRLGNDLLEIYQNLLRK